MEGVERVPSDLSYFWAIIMVRRAWLAMFSIAVWIWFLRSFVISSNWPSNPYIWLQPSRTISLAPFTKIIFLSPSIIIVPFLNNFTHSFSWWTKRHFLNNRITFSSFLNFCFTSINEFKKSNFSRRSWLFRMLKLTQIIPN